MYEERALALAREHLRRGTRIPPHEHAQFYEGVPVELRDDFTALSKQLRSELEREKHAAPWTRQRAGQ